MELNEVSDCEVHSVWPETSEYYHLFQSFLALSFPFARKLGHLWLWLGRRVPTVPFLGIHCHCRWQACISFRNCLLKFSDVVPGTLCEPFNSRLWLGGNSTYASFEEETPFVFIDLAVAHLEFDAHLKGKHKFVFLEERSAGALVNIQSVNLANGFHSVLHSKLLFADVNVPLEKTFVPVKRELVHGINLVQVVEHEEKNCRHLSTLTEGLTSLVNALHCALGLLQFLLDFI